MADQILSRSEPLTIRANFAWNFMGKVAYAGSRALILLLIAKLGTAEMVGQYALAFAVTTPVFMALDMDLRSVLATDTLDRHGFESYLGLRACTTALAMIAVCAAALMQATPQTAAVLLAVGAARGADAISDMLYGLMQRHERLDRPGISLLLKSVLSVLAVGVLLALRQGLVLGCAGMALAWLAVLLFYDIPSVRPFARVRVRLKRRELWALARLSLPLGAVLLFSSVLKNLPNYFINAHLGTAALGYFSSIVYILTTGSLVDTALTQSANARMARLFSQGNIRAFTSVFRRIAAMAAAMGACMLVAAAAFGSQILTLLYRPEYAAYAGVFVTVMAAAGVTYGTDVAGAALTAARKFRIQPVLNGSALLAGLALNAWLVPRLGMEGAALCILAASGLQLAGNLAALGITVRKASVQARSMGRSWTVERAAFPATDEKTLQDWREILRRQGCENAFADPDWLRAWWGVWGNGHEPLLLLMRISGKLTAVFPLMARRKLGVTTIRFMGAPQATHTDAACLPEYRAEAACALAETVRAMKGAVIADFAGLREDGGFTAALRQELTAKGIPCQPCGTPTFILRVGSPGIDEYLSARLSRHGMKNIRRQEAKLRRFGEVSYRFLDEASMPEAFALHDDRWRMKMDTSGFTSARSRIFFSGLLGAPSAGWQALALGLYLDGRLIAFEYGFLCGSRSLHFKSAHDDRLGVCAPGNMVKREFMRRLCALGAQTVDLGVGYEEYKADWTDDRETLTDLAFPGASALSFLPYLWLSGKKALRACLKRSRKLVLFKRNTLGRWRYHLQKHLKGARA